MYMKVFIKLLGAIMIEAVQPALFETTEECCSEAVTIDSGPDHVEQPFPCAACQKYREDPWPPPDSTTYYWNFEWDELSRASARGCPICSTLHSIVSSVITNPITKFTAIASESKGFYFVAPPSDSNYFEVYSHESKCALSKPVYRRNRISQELITGIEAPKEFPSVHSARDISSSGSSEECLKLAKRWLHTCVSTHTLCVPASKSYLPTRVIDVGSSTTEPHLYIPGGRGKEGAYIALSHCWGTEKPPLQTTAKNLFSMCREIPMSDLPRNFQDAVKVARALGIRYLWIDSLCILQDSKDDWYSESGYMSDVYADALFVLVAAERNSCESGFLEGKRRPQMTPITIGQASVKEMSSLSVRLLPRLIDPYGGHYRQSRQRSKLSTRGWAFQEQILARRILAYSDEEMSWECLEYGLCECQTTKKIPKSINARLFIQNAFKMRDHDYFHQMWTSCIQEYTLRNLSFASDRLTAFLGVAKKVASVTTGRYLAGVWHWYLPHGLAWLASGNSQIFDYGGERQFQSRRQEPNYAPSWSWASITGPVTFWWVTTKIKPIWDILIRRVHYLDEGGWYLSGKEASLQLAGRLMRVTIGEPRFKDDKFPLFKIFLPDNSTVEQGKSLGFLANPDIWDSEYYNFGGSYYLLSLFHYEDDNRPQDNIEFLTSAAALALVLRRTDEEKIAYERVACVLLTKEEHTLYWTNSEETEFTFL